MGGVGRSTSGAERLRYLVYSQSVKRWTRVARIVLGLPSSGAAMSDAQTRTTVSTDHAHTSEAAAASARMNSATIMLRPTLSAQ